MDIERLKELKTNLIFEKAVSDEATRFDRDSETNRTVHQNCNDLISLIDAESARQSVKSEEVQEAITTMQAMVHCNNGADCDSCPKTTTCNDSNERHIAMKLAITALQAYRPWISVSERLPDDINEYLIVIKHKYECEKKWQYDVDVATSNGSYLNNFWDTDNDWDEGQEIYVTHWQPLPEPPKGE